VARGSTRGRRPLVVALTGGAGAGKSAAAEVLRELGVPVLDTDEVSRELTRAGSPLLAEIAAALGPDALAPDGGLDRAAVRRRILADAAARRRLEAILHPRIRERVERWIAACRAPYCVVVVPLLVEAGWTDLADRVLVVDAPEALQRARLRTRGLSGPEIDAMLRAQADRGTRLAAADVVIRNDRDLAALEAAVRGVHARLQAQAAGAGPERGRCPR